MGTLHLTPSLPCLPDRPPYNLPRSTMASRTASLCLLVLVASCLVADSMGCIYPAYGLGMYGGYGYGLGGIGMYGGYGLGGLGLGLVNPLIGGGLYGGYGYGLGVGKKYY